MSDTRTTVTIFGPGALGGAAIDLIHIHKQFELVSVWSRKSNDCKLFSPKTGKVLKVSKPFPSRVEDLGDIVLLTVPDDEIEAVSQQLANSGLSLKGKRIVHMSGSKNDSALRAVKKKGALTASLHPLQSFTKGDRAERFNGIWFTLQGDESLHKILEQLTGLYSAGIVRMTAEQKSAMHLAAVFASNYLVSLMDIVETAASRKGIRNSLELLKPIIEQTLDKTFEKGAAESLSGPVVRGDMSTLRSHLQQIEDTDSLTSVYKVLGIAAADLSEKAGRLDRDRADEIRELFANKQDESKK